ncbi:outer membrane protein A [Klebsiella variicola]|uniref:Outer membrane protein A n=1 Tax=Klebsiella variicola TaxID=244366 RepID=A0A7H4M9H7_KLEVA|nr:outer membrane protein A [Klebsiella variicola]
MDVQEAKLRDKMQGTGVSVTRNGDNIVLNMPNNVTFDSNSANLKPAGANTLTGVAMVLKEYEKPLLTSSATPTAPAARI